MPAVHRDRLCPKKPNDGHDCGEHPIERPMTPNDLWATVYQHLGIDWEQSFLDHTGRPMPILPFGEPIPELLPVG